MDSSHPPLPSAHLQPLQRIAWALYTELLLWLPPSCITAAAIPLLLLLHSQLGRRSPQCLAACRQRRRGLARNRLGLQPSRQCTRPCSEAAGPGLDRQRRHSGTQLLGQGGGQCWWEQRAGPAAIQTLDTLS